MILGFARALLPIEAVTAGRISDVLEISTARVAVLIKKMVSRGLVTKEYSVIDTIGEEQLMEFIAIRDEVRSVVSPPKLNF